MSAIMTQRMVFLLSRMVTKNCVAQTKNVTKMGVIIKGVYYSWGFYAKNFKTYSLFEWVPTI